VRFPDIASADLPDAAFLVRDSFKNARTRSSSRRGFVSVPEKYRRRSDLDGRGI